MLLNILPLFLVLVMMISGKSSGQKEKNDFAEHRNIIVHHPTGGHRNTTGHHTAGKRATDEYPSSKEDWHSSFGRGGKCVKLFHENKTISMQSALDACHEEKANLVSLEDEADYRHLKWMVKKWGEGGRFWTGLVLYRNSKTGKVISASFVDGTSSAYVNPVKIGSGNGPWAISELHPEPEKHNPTHNCISFASNNTETNPSLRIHKTGLIDQECNATHVVGYFCQKACAPTQGWFHEVK